MYGVVVWVRPGASAAIIWCADSKELAYMSREIATQPSAANLNAGDLVWIDCREQGSMRYCTAFELIEENYDPDLVGRIDGQVRPGTRPSMPDIQKTALKVVNDMPARRAG